MKSSFIALAVSLISLTPNPSPTGEGSIHTYQKEQHQKLYTPLAHKVPLALWRGVRGEAGVGGEAFILFTGDILLDRGVRRVIDRQGADALFSQDIDSVFSASDIVVGNLECPATKVKSPVFKRYIFRGEPEHLATLRKHGFTHLNLCNNHSIDQGREGLTDTKRNIEQSGMVSVGAGRNMNEAAQPVLLTGEPRKVWLLTSLRMALENWAPLDDRPCVSQEPMDSLISRIRRLKKADSTAVIVVSLHWGGEHTLRPVPLQRMEAHRLIDTGADVLVCHHTHTLQTIEKYKGKMIYYSIGNFIFDQPKPLNAKACMVRLKVTKEKTEVETIPILIKNCVPFIRKTFEKNH